MGCIPSKALLHSSEIYHHAKSGMDDHGISTGDVEIDIKKMIERKAGIVSNLTSGIDGLFKKNRVDRINGFARLVGEGKIEVRAENETSIVDAKNIILATGSVPLELAFIPFDEKRIVSSTGALEFDEVPEHLVVVGGGVIGLELGSVWLRLGAKVTVVEFADRLCPTMDKQVSRELRKVLKKQGFKFHLSTSVVGAKVGKKTVELFCEDKKGEPIELNADKVLISVGRRPFVTGLGCEEMGIKFDERGRIEVDENFQTNIENIYAIGDVIDGPMLAHKAEEDGVAAAQIIAGKSGHVNYDIIPGVVYTWPEVATVGQTEEELKKQDIEFNKGVFSFRANGRAMCMDAAEGFVKILADKETDRILGVHIVGPNASELIAEAVLAMEYKASAEDIALTIHAHPTLSEVVKEAAMDVDNRAIHM